MRILKAAAFAVALVVTSAHAASADILVRVDLAGQRMTVDVDGKQRHVWAVSTAAPAYVTPTGTYRPQRMHTMWYSKKYDDAPMPHSIFYSGGYAIHGTQAIRSLGRPASHGCVRLAPANAKALFDLVKSRGMARTRIVIHGKPPAPAPAPQIAAKRKPEPRTVYTYRAPPQQGLFSSLFGEPQPRRVYRREAYQHDGIRYYRVPMYRR